MQGLLKASAATRTVNPVKPAVPVGHGDRTFYSRLHSDICVQALVLEDGAGTRVVWMTCDFCQVAREVTDKVKGLIKKKHGISPEAVCVHATHNHAAPPIIKREAPDEFDPEYADYFVEQAVGVVGDAIPGLAPAGVRYCEDACTSAAINRRGRKDGELCIFPDNRGIVDFKVRVMEIKPAGYEKPSVILAEYAAHPVVVAESGLGGEYPSFMRRFLEKRYSGAAAMFFQGCSGNIRARLLDRDRGGWIKGTPEIAERFGCDLGEAVERALSQEWAPVTGPVEFEYREVAAPLKREAEPNTWPLRIQAFRLGAGSKAPFTLVGIGAESFIEYGLELERRLKPANSIVIGCANGCEGYLPTATAIEEGGYEPNAWGERCYNIPGPYAPEVESIALEAATDLARPKH